MKPLLPVSQWARPRSENRWDSSDRSREVENGRTKLLAGQVGAEHLLLLRPSERRRRDGGVGRGAELPGQEHHARRHEGGRRRAVLPLEREADAVVGTATVVGEGYPDDTAWDPSSEHPDPKSTPDKPLWYMVDIKAESEFARHVTLEEIKQTPGLEKMALVNRSRLSVQPVRPEEWRIIVGLGSAPEQP